MLSLFAYFLGCHPYILLHFQCFLVSCFYVYVLCIFIKIIKNHTGVGLVHAQPNNIQHSVCYKIDIHTT